MTRHPLNPEKNSRHHAAREAIIAALVAFERTDMDAAFALAAIAVMHLSHVADVDRVIGVVRRVQLEQGDTTL